MALSRSLFELNPHDIQDPHVAAKKLGQALIDTMSVEAAYDADVLWKFWALLGAFRIGAIEGGTFLLELRRALPK